MKTLADRIGLITEIDEEYYNSAVHIRDKRGSCDGIMCSKCPMVELLIPCTGDARDKDATVIARIMAQHYIALYKEAKAKESLTDA